jgi:protein-disulfide isomerase/uncharacterized membrane protein
MTKKNNLLLVSLLITVSIFIYLTIHHYMLKLGLNASSLCSISQTVNCDAAALSKFAEIFSIPIALMGAVFHFILLCFVLFYRLNWIDQSVYLQKTIRFMLLLAALTSLVIGAITLTFVKVICPFCVATYVFSFVNLFLGWDIAGASSKEKWSLAAYFGEYKSHLIALALIPASAWILSAMVQEKFGLAELNKIIPEKIAQWKNSKSYAFDPAIGLSNNVASDKIVLVEFADFKCPHCKAASQTIDTFLKSRNDVRFIFKPFPLDGTCNTSEQMQKGDGSRCTLAAWTLCAEKIAQKGWDMHHWIFDKQEELSGVSDLSSYLPEIEKMFQIKPEALTACADSTETYDLIKKSSTEGNNALVSGTPTIYLNGKKLGYGHIMEVLKSAVNELQ